MKCDKCDGPVFAIEPGSSEIRELFLLRPAVPMRCWCLRHWWIEFGRKAA